jgi:two-component system, sensor histidine kinase LadS
VLHKLFAFILCVCFAHPAAADDLGRLFDDSQALTLAAPLQWQALPKGSVRNPAEFDAPTKNAAFAVVAHHGEALPTAAERDVWLRFALPATSAPQVWYLRMPRLGVERITLYSQNPQGQWMMQMAGDSVPMTQWPERTRNPSFQLTTRIDKVQSYFVKLENNQPIFERPQLIAPSDYIDGAQQVGILVGLMIGLFGLLTILGLLTARLYRNYHYAWYALMVCMLLLTQLVLLGYAGFQLWPDSPYLVRIMPVVVPMWTVAATTWFVAQVSYARNTAPIPFKLSIGCIALLVGSSLAFAAMPSSFPRAILQPIVAAVMLLNLSFVVWTALRSQSWMWFIAAGFAPLTLAMLARIAYNAGWIAHVEVVQFISVVAGCLGMMIVYAGMLFRSRESYGAQQREAALLHTDISTGLTLGRIADIRLPQVLQRSERFGKPCGVVMVRWLGYDAQLAPMSSAQRGAVLAHFGARLRRLARDIDTVARLDNDHFLFLIESPITREVLSELGTRIISSCMRPSVQLGNGDVYNVHVAIAECSGQSMSHSQVMEALRTRINHMGLQTPRRMQFVDSPLSTRPPGEGPESTGTLTSDALVAKINALEATHVLPTIATRQPSDPLATMVGRTKP